MVVTLDKMKKYLRVDFVDDDVLLHDALVVNTPGQEGDVITAPLAELVQCVGEGNAVCQSFLVKACDLLYFIVNTSEKLRTYVDGEFFAGGHIGVQLDCTDFNDLAAQMDRKLVEHCGVRAHCLIPLQIHDNIIHSDHSFR